MVFAADKHPFSPHSGVMVPEVDEAALKFSLRRLWQEARSDDLR